MTETRQHAPTEHDDRTIVLGVDGSQHARWALKWAAEEAKRRGSLLKIIYAPIAGPENTPPWYDVGSSDLLPGEAIVDDAYALVATRHPSVVARAEVVRSSPAKGLIEASRSAELLVVGARGRGGFDELLLGSVSDQCIQYAHCPIVIVHADPDEPPLRAIEPRIVVGLDGSLGSTRALRWSLEEAQARSASVLGIHAWQFPPIGSFLLGPRQGCEAAAREILDSAIDSATEWAPDVSFDVVGRCEDTVPALLDGSVGAELLVVGAHGYRGFKDALVGSVAHQCARHAQCAVVVARLDTPDDDPLTAQLKRSHRPKDSEKIRLVQYTP